MIENIAIIVGVISVLCSVFTMVVMLLLKKNVIDILNKDAIIYDKNFEIKKNAINLSLNLIDEIELKGKSIILQEPFMRKAKYCYNELMCVVNDMRLVEIFHNIALNREEMVTPSIIQIYKMLCRSDMGLKTKLPKQKPVEDAQSNETVLKANALANTNSESIPTNNPQQKIN